MKLSKVILTLLSSISLLAPTFALAASEHVGLHGLSENLAGPVDVITRLMLFACFVVGVAMILGAALQYWNHLQSPKLVPLTTPIFLLIIGIVAVLLPYASTLPEEHGSILKKDKSLHESTYHDDSENDDGDDVNEESEEEE